MRPSSIVALALWVSGAGISAAERAAASRPLSVSFHHIHVNDPNPQGLVAYYEKLFRADTTRPVTIGQVRGIQSGGVFLLIDLVARRPPESGGAGWHFGWGTVSLDEAYDRHRMQEIEWELPLESFSRDLHLHLESENPAKAGQWYRDTLGATVELSPASADVQPPNPAHRRPMAIVRLENVTLAIYKAAAALAPSRGHRIDHVAFRADLAAARAHPGLTVLTPSARLGTFETTVIEGPDQLAIELVGAPSFPPPSSVAR